MYEFLWTILYILDIIKSTYITYYMYSFNHRFERRRMRNNKVMSTLSGQERTNTIRISKFKRKNFQLVTFYPD